MFIGGLVKMKVPRVLRARSGRSVMIGTSELQSFTESIVSRGTPVEILVIACLSNVAPTSSKSDEKENERVR